MLLAGIGAGSQGHPRPWLLGGHSCGVAWGSAQPRVRPALSRSCTDPGSIQLRLLSLGFGFCSLTLCQGHPEVTPCHWWLQSHPPAALLPAGSPGCLDSTCDTALLPLASLLCTDHILVLQLGVSQRSPPHPVLWVPNLHLNPLTMRLPLFCMAGTSMGFGLMLLFLTEEGAGPAGGRGSSRGEGSGTGTGGQADLGMA